MQFCTPRFKKDIKVLERIQTRTTKQVKGLEGMSLEEQLGKLGLSGLEEKELKGSLIALCSFLRRKSGEGSAELFSRVSSDSAHSCGSKLCQGPFRLDIRKHFFTEAVVKRWSRLPGEVINAPRLSVCKRHLDNTLNNTL